MASLRDEITNTIRRLHNRAVKSVAQGVQPSDDPSSDDTLLATDPRIGRHYRNYRVLRRLGVGGMGHVYLALDTHLGRHAALKFLSPKLKSSPGMLDRLKQEARTASSLNHPNILTIYDIDEAQGEPFIASEFVEGVTLKLALERGAVDPESALEIAIQIASALKPAHEAGIVHRDLKPGNVMLRPDGLVKVIDFGLAKFTAQGHVAPLYEPVSDPGWVAGTVQYMSPEQARGDEVDQRTDLWSLGVILYETVSRRKPFDGETESHIIVAILDHRPAELKILPGVPAELAGVVDKALAKDPGKRYQSAEEMLDALRALDGSSKPRTASKMRAARSRVRNTRRIWMASILGALAAGLALWWWPLHGRDAVMGPDWFAPLNYTQVTHRGDVTLASISPDGKRIVYRTTANNMDQLHLLNLETKAEWKWPPFAGDTMGMSFSPDSAIVYYTVHDQREWGRLYAARENSKDPTFVLDDVDGPISFSPDGTEFAFRRRSDEKRTNRESIVVVKAADTGDQRIILSKYNTLVGPRVAWSAGGVIAVNLVKGDLTGAERPTVLLFSSDGRELAQHSDRRLRRLSGPAWLDSRSMLIFSGFGRSSDASESGVIELSARTGQFRFFTSPPLLPNSMTVSNDYRSIAALSFTRKSALWVAPADRLDAPQKWSGDDSLATLAWDWDDSIVHPSLRAGNMALWRTAPGKALEPLPQESDCMSRQPVAVPKRRMLVFSSNCRDSANASNLWLLDEADGKLEQLTEHSSSDEKPAAAADGDTVLYDSWPNNFPALMKISLRTRVKSQFSALQARHAAISPDSQSVACQIRENYDGRWRVAVLSMLDGAIQMDNLPLPAGFDSVVRWSPNGKALDYVDERDPANVWRYQLARSSAMALTHLQGQPISDFAWNANGTRLAWISSDIRRDAVIFHKGAGQ